MAEFRDLTKEEIEDNRRRAREDCAILFAKVKKIPIPPPLEKFMFIENKMYRRKEISDALGGGIEDYLPHTNGKVVCGCFRLDFNPDAPDVILVGDKEDVIKWDNVYSSQLGFIPIFIRHSNAEWEYVGDYKVKSSSDDPEVIAPYAEKAERDCIDRVLFLKKSE